MEASNKIKVYKGNGAKGYYYSINDKSGESRLVPKQDTSSFSLDLNKYEIITSNEAKEIRSSIRKQKDTTAAPAEKISYEDVNVGEVAVRISVKNIKEVASKYNFVISAKAIDVYRNLLTSVDSFDTILAGHREKFPNMNHIDFDVRTKKIIVDKKKFSKVDEVTDQLATISVSE